MKNKNQPKLPLVDNHFGDPTNGGQGQDISLLAPEQVELLSRYSGKPLNQWSDGVVVFPDTPLREHRLHVRQRAAHPFQFRVGEFLFDEGGAHVVVGEGGAVGALGDFVQLDFEILDVGGLELLGDALLYVARGLADLEQARVRRVGNRVGVEARTRRRLWR